ncbi:MAG: DedA family protein [Dysgonamonadaceae bacterium]
MHFLIDFILHIDVHLAQLVAEYGTWVYVILFIIIFCETGLVVTPFLPGDSLIFVAGTLAALPSNDLNIVFLTGIISFAAIVGDSVNFEIGKLFGVRLFSNPNSKIFKQEYLDKTHKFYSKHGGKTIILARFVPIVRTFAPFVAGMGRMNYRYFISYNVFGGIFWVALFSLLGYFVGNLPWVQSNLKFLIVLIIFVSVLPAVIEYFRNKFKKKLA